MERVFDKFNSKQFTRISKATNTQPLINDATHANRDVSVELRLRLWHDNDNDNSSSSGCRSSNRIANWQLSVSSCFGVKLKFHNADIY